VARRLSNLRTPGPLLFAGGRSGAPFQSVRGLMPFKFHSLTAGGFIVCSQSGSGTPRGKLLHKDKPLLE
jgi:hypothetical protein